jgi:hypothetical protein
MASNAMETQKQENCSRLFFQYFIEKNIELSIDQLSKIYPKIDSKWYNSFRGQAYAMKNFLLKGSTGLTGRRPYVKGFVYSRDDGIMPFLVGISSRHCGISSKDSWNTMDIVMVLSNKEKQIKEQITKMCTGPNKDNNLESLNGLMRKYFVDGILYGISLKDIPMKMKIANVEVSNLKIKNKKSTDLSYIEYVKGSLKCNLEISENSVMFDTGEASAGFRVYGKEVGIQHRNFRYSDARGVVQTDVTGKGAAAKFGKASAAVITEYLTSIGLEKPASPGKDPNIDPPGEWTEKNIKYWIKWFKDMEKDLVDGSKVNFGNIRSPLGKGFNNVLQYAISTEMKDRSSAGRLSSKLVSLRWVKIYQEISKKKKLQEWISVLYYAAKKEGGTKNGVFIKISE